MTISGFLLNNTLQHTAKKILVLLVAFTLLSVSSCSEDNEEITEDNKTEISFKFNSENVQQDNRQSVTEIPPCSEAEPSYVMIALTGAETIGSIASPQRVEFNTATGKSEALRLDEGSYQLEYFAVFDSSDNLIWYAPTDSQFSEYVVNPLPQAFSITAYQPSTLDIDVICHDDRFLNDPVAITAEDYVAGLGAGFDVTWSEFGRYMELYQEQVATDMGDAGFRNVRIRVQEDNPDATFITDLRQQIQDAIDHGMNPIVAFQGRFLEDEATSDEEARTYLVEWWRNMALELQDLPSELAFNVMVEISGTYKTDYEAINSFYSDVYDAIRESNPNRIIIFPPVNISNPEYLQFLEIPGGDDPYIMAEWHFYAAGPDPTPGSRKYWKDGSTLEERRNLLDPIETAVSWMNETGYVSWVGAWMAGNYNKGNDYTVEEQVGIASFITRTLNSYDIPFAVNAGNKFYDYEALEWFNRSVDAGGIPIRDAILDPDAAAVYTGIDYLGIGVRLDPDTYSSSQLSTLGVLENIQSVMVPFDFEVRLYEGDNQTGNSIILDITTRDVSDFTVRSIEVLFKNTY